LDTAVLPPAIVIIDVELKLKVPVFDNLSAEPLNKIVQLEPAEEPALNVPELVILVVVSDEPLVVIDDPLFIVIVPELVKFVVPVKLKLVLLPVKTPVTAGLELF
jgi:hypothetical protein